jgi:hypothetical protein
LIRKVLSAPKGMFDDGLREDRITINRIEIKFWKLMRESFDRLKYTHQPATGKAVIEHALDIVIKCMVWSGITVEERRIIDESQKIWDRIFLSEKIANW